MMVVGTSVEYISSAIISSFVSLSGSSSLSLSSKGFIVLSTAASTTGLLSCGRCMLGGSCVEGGWCVEGSNVGASSSASITPPQVDRLSVVS